MFGLYERPLAYQCVISRTYKSRYKKEILKSIDNYSTVHETEYRGKRNEMLHVKQLHNPTMGYLVSIVSLHLNMHSLHCAWSE